MKRCLFLVLAMVFWAAVLRAQPMDTAEFRQAREAMVLKQIRNRGIVNATVLDAMQAVPRHCFVPSALVHQAYADHPLPIGEGQTISQPYIVALMTASLGLTETMRVLEIGTGSGYQAAILSKIAGEVYTIEIKEKLYKKATSLLTSLGFDSIMTRHGDGYFGWNESIFFDCIMITAAVDHIPPPLLKQLMPGGRLILPLGNPFGYQNLVLVTKQGADYTVRNITDVLFVPLTGYALEK